MPYCTDALMPATLPSIMKEHLTPREQEVFTLLVNGLKYQSIADRLYISRNTVKFHTSNIYLKTGVKNRIELILKNKKL